MNDPAPRLGIDIGRVIIDGPHHRGEDTGFFHGDDDALLATPEVPGAIGAISRLTLMFGAQNTWLISKCGNRVQVRSLIWLNGHSFWARTGMLPDHTRFVRTRPEKLDVCRDLGITHYVDDRPDVLAPMYGAIPHRYLFGPQDQRARGGVIAVPGWTATEAAVREDFPQ